MKYRHDIALLFNELAILLESGIKVPEALQIIQAEPDPALTPIINKLSQAVVGGTPLSEALSKQPKYFDTFIVDVIKTGEKNNQLISTLYAVVEFLQTDLDERELTKQVSLSLIYVIFLLGIAFLVAIGLLNYTVPVFDDLYSGFGAELPALTQFFIAFGEYSIFILIAFVILLGLSIWNWYQIAFNLPLLGKLYHLTAISHFLHTTGFILQHGGTMQQALEGAGHSMSYNRHYSQKLIQASQKISSGKSTAEVLKASKLFPKKVIHALHIGENRPQFANLLLQLAAVYRFKVNQSFEPRLRLFSFITLVLVGIFIGALVIAMYLPIFNMGMVI